MIVATAVLALFVAAGLTALFMPALGWPEVQGKSRPASTLLFCMIVFLSTLVGGLWVIPIGPEIYGAPVAPMLVEGVLSALLVAALIPGRGAARSRVYFWLLTLGLLMTIVVWYLI